MLAGVFGVVLALLAGFLVFAMPPAVQGVVTSTAAMVGGALALAYLMFPFAR